MTIKGTNLADKTDHPDAGTYDALLTDYIWADDWNDLAETVNNMWSGVFTEGLSVTGAITGTNTVTITSTTSKIIDLFQNVAGTPANYILFRDQGGNTAYIGHGSAGNDYLHIQHYNGGDIVLATTGGSVDISQSALKIGGSLGSAGQVLETDGTNISWQTPSAGAHPTAVTGMTQVQFTAVSARTKVQLWSDTNWGIGMGASYTFGGLNDYAFTNQVSDSSTSRGWWWGGNTHTDAQGAMALTVDGYANIAGGLRIGFGSTETTKASAGLQVTGTIDINSGLLYFNPSTLKVGGTGNVHFTMRHIDGKASATDTGDTLYVNYSIAGKGMQVGDTGTDHPLVVKGTGTFGSYLTMGASSTASAGTHRTGHTTHYLQGHSQYGWFTIGAGNATYLHINTDRANFYFYKNVYHAQASYFLSHTHQNDNIYTYWGTGDSCWIYFDTANYLYLDAFTNSNGFKFNAHLLPHSANARDLGNTTYYWDELYIYDVLWFGSPAGSAGTAIIKNGSYLYYATSSVRYKEQLDYNFEVDALGIIDDLQFLQYEYKRRDYTKKIEKGQGETNADQMQNYLTMKETEDRNQNKQFGFVAEQFEQVLIDKGLPTNTNGHVLGMSYTDDGLVENINTNFSEALSFKAIQQLSTKVKELEAEILLLKEPKV